MLMIHTLSAKLSSRLLVTFISALSWLALSNPALAQTKKKNPSSKVYVADVNGSSLVTTEELSEELDKRSVYNAEGTTFETKGTAAESDAGMNSVAMVFSNGTGAALDGDTKVEMRSFKQEPFSPNRTDFESEPSVSQTRAFVARGSVGLCNSKMVAGSSMNYETSQGSVSIRGKKVVIEAKGNVTKISMLEGDSTVRGGAGTTGGETLKSGEQAVITSGGPGQPSQVRIEKIPESEKTKLEDKVAMACQAKQQVYFEVKSASTTTTAATAGQAITNEVTAFDGATGGSAAAATAAAVTAANEVREAVVGAVRPAGTIAPITAATTGTQSVGVGEIFAIPIVPANLPTQFTVSVARIVIPAPTR